MPRPYVPIGLFDGLIGDEPVTVFECPDDGLPVVDTAQHDRWHERTRTVSCRCPQSGEAEPETWYCQVHDRSNRPKGEPVRTEQVTLGPSLWGMGAW